MSTVFDPQSRFVEAPSAAFITANEYVRQEMHFDLAYAVAFARLAASAFYVEREPAGFVAVNSAFGQFGEESSDLVEDFDVGRGVAARRSTDRALVDVDDFVELVEAFESTVLADSCEAADQFACGRWVEDVIDERRFAGAGNTGDRGQDAERNLNVDVEQVVLLRAMDLEAAGCDSPRLGYFDPSPTGEIGPGQ